MSTQLLISMFVLLRDKNQESDRFFLVILLEVTRRVGKMAALQPDVRRKPSAKEHDGFGGLTSISST